MFVFDGPDELAPTVPDLNDNLFGLSCADPVASRWYTSITKDTYTSPPGGAYHRWVVAWAICGDGCDSMEIWGAAIDYITDWETDNPGWTGYLDYQSQCDDTIRTVIIPPLETTPAAPNETTTIEIDEDPPSC